MVYFLSIIIFSFLGLVESKIKAVVGFTNQCEVCPKNIEIPLLPDLDIPTLLKVNEEELTPYGMNFCYNLGLSFRDRYINKEKTDTYLEAPSKFNVVDYRFITSQKRSSIQSMVSLFHGLFPQEKGSSPTIDKEPFEEQTFCLPYGSTAPSLQSELLMNDVGLNAENLCLEYQENLERYIDSSEWKNIEKKYNSERENILKELKIEKEYSLIEMDKVFRVAEILKLYKQYTMKDITWNDIVDINNIITRKSYSNEFLSSNILRRDLMEYFQNYVLGNEVEKFRLVSTTSPVYYSLLYTLLITKNIHGYDKAPSYGSTLLFELHEEDDLFVKTYIFEDGSFHEIKNISNLGENIQFKHLSLEIEKLPNKDLWCAECRNTESEDCLYSKIGILKKQKNIKWIIIAIISSLILFLGLAFPILLLQRFVYFKKTKRGKYQHLT